jgi:hypothetical protein
MSPRARPLLLFLLLLLLFPAAASVARWWQGAALGWLEWAGVLAFPLLAWLWLRHFSVLGCRHCPPPTQPPRAGPEPGTGR